MERIVTSGVKRPSERAGASGMNHDEDQGAKTEEFRRERTGEVDLGTPGNDRRAKEDTKEKARTLGREAEQVGKTVAAEQLGALAGGIRKSAEGWDDQRHAWVKQYLGDAADGLDRFSSTLREKNLGAFLTDAEALARRHPAMFAACCAAAGFALTRFLKSGKRDVV
jgi:hypothetical protein